MLHQVVQFIIDAIIKILKLVVKLINKLAKKDHIIQIKIINFLPKISDNCHKNGQEKNEKNA
jgi:hypothetical protein